jgi:hypothetical protein
MLRISATACSTRSRTAPKVSLARARSLARGRGLSRPLLVEAGADAVRDLAQQRPDAVVDPVDLPAERVG